MGEESASVDPVYHSPRAESEDEIVLAAQAEYDPWAPALVDTPYSPADTVHHGQTPSVYSTWAGSASPHFANSRASIDHVMAAEEEREATPDHPCNYCHQLHWFKGPRATPCPAGTQLPSAARHAGGHNRRGHRKHLPGTECSICGQRHWCSGPEVVPCESRFLLTTDRRSRASSRSLPKPKRACRRCGTLHYITGPWKSACQKHRSTPAESATFPNSGTSAGESLVVKQEKTESSVHWHVPWHNR